MFFMQYPKIILKNNKEKSLLRKHPWIFSGAIAKMEGHANEGDIIEVYSAHNEFLALGHYQQKGSISVRVLSFIKQPVNSSFWYHKILNARNIRQSLPFIRSQACNAYRLIHGEGDNLPGLIIDIYNQTAVIQCHSSGMIHSLKEISEALQKVYHDKLQVIYHKHPDNHEQMPGAYLLNNLPLKQCEISEYGHKFIIDWESGQKTGFFLDQRENRKLLSEYATNKKILNTFSYTGGFSIYALGAGAAAVTSVDISEKASKLNRQNTLLNGYSQPHQIVTADVMDYLKTTDDNWDIIVLDPPAFAKHLSAKHNAIKAYRRINKEAIQKIKNGGLLFTFSCSQVIDKLTFEGIVRSAAIECGKEIKIIHRLSQPQDHPVSVYHPEGEYLKGLVLWVGS
jgi:23S rRNA (cytosine1962-C5)-methyltransferase